jgi:gluconate kinase
MSNVLFLGGPAGSGKTTLGDALAATWGAPHLDFDEVTAPVVTRFHRSHPEFSEAAVLEATRADRYAALRVAVMTSIRSHPNVVVSAPLRQESASASAWRSWIAPIQDAGAQVQLMWLHVSARERWERMARRGLLRDQPAFAADPAELSPPAFADRILDAQRPLSDLLSQVGSSAGSNFDIS